MKSFLKVNLLSHFFMKLKTFLAKHFPSKRYLFSHFLLNIEHDINLNTFFLNFGLFTNKLPHFK